MRWYWRLALIALSIGLLSLAFAPWKQFWLAWLALAPLFVSIRQTRGVASSFLWGWSAGVLFFALNMSWLWTASIPGTFAVCIILGLFWGLTAAGMRAIRPRASPTADVLLTAIIWCAGEWLRGLAVGGFPWLLLGHSQSPVPAMCQVADVLSVGGVSFWVAAVNALIAMLVIRRCDVRSLRGAIATVVVMLLAVGGYGMWRTGQREVLYNGPRVMLVQCSFPYGRGGVPAATREQIAQRHFELTREALAATVPPPKLIVWPEAMMPPLNPEARDELRRASVGPFLARTHEQIVELTRAADTSLVTGGHYVGRWADDSKARVAKDRRNSAYLYTPHGFQPALRYDKIELVPFAESMPLAGAPAWVRGALLWLAAPAARQPDTPGNALVGFELPASSARFVTPICFENIDAPFIAQLVRSSQARFIVNLTNDGWFTDQERAQHLQAVVFRAIENRVPIARASNTGISAFVDSTGRVTGSLPPQSEGTLTQSLVLDRRSTFYTRFGDVFPLLCTIAALAAIATKCRPRR